MDAQSPTTSLEHLTRSADRLDELADTCALMDDDAGAERLRALASDCRLCAMALLDD